MQIAAPTHTEYRAPTDRPFRPIIQLLREQWHDRLEHPPVPVDPTKGAEAAPRPDGAPEEARALLARRGDLAGAAATLERLGSSITDQADFLTQLTGAPSHAAAAPTQTDPKAN